MAVTSFAGWIRRQWRTWGANPLIRTSDRLEALAVLAVVVIGLVGVPVAAHAGAQMRETGLRTAAAQSHSRHAVEAVTVEASASMPADFASPAYVRVQWREGTRMRNELVLTPETLKAAQPLTIWLDDTGKVVTAPLTAENAELRAIGAAGTIWVALVVLGVLAAVVVRRSLDRARDLAWERELRLLTHNDDGWANRHI